MTRARVVFYFGCIGVVCGTLWLFLNRPGSRNLFNDMIDGGADSSRAYLYGGIAACLTIWMVCTIAARRRARRWWLCQRCRYDLRPFKEASRVCPECGETNHRKR